MNDADDDVDDDDDDGVVDGTVNEYDTNKSKIFASQNSNNSKALNISPILLFIHLNLSHSHSFSRPRTHTSCKYG